MRISPGAVKHADAAPHTGWLREVYFHLAVLSREEATTSRRTAISRSAVTDETKPVIFTTPFASDASSGHTFSPEHS